MEINKISLIYVKDRKLLVAFSRGKEVFFLPGGKKEPGESDEDTLVREIREELSADVIRNTIKFYASFSEQAFGHPEGTIVAMRCFIADLAGSIKPSSEVERIKWVDSHDVGESTPIGRKVLEDLKRKNLID